MKLSVASVGLTLVWRAGGSCRDYDRCVTDRARSEAGMDAGNPAAADAAAKSVTEEQATAGWGAGSAEGAVAELLARVRAGEVRALARAVSLVEDGAEGATELLRLSEQVR